MTGSPREMMEVSFRALLEAAPDAMVIVDQRGLIVLVNAQAEKVFGYTREELLGQHVEMLVPQRYRGAHASQRAGYHADPRARAMGSGLDLFGVRKGGAEFPVEISLSPLDTGSGVLVSSAIRDVSERKRAEETRARLAAIVDTSDDAIFAKTIDGVIESWNVGAERLFGYAASEIVGKSATVLAPPDRPDELSELRRRVAAGERVSHHEILRVCKDGTAVEVSISLSPILDRVGSVIGVASIARDVAPSKQAARERKALREKEVLLKEIHHRVKNNLQVISSMLNLQAGYVTDERAMEMFRECQDRVRSIALFHERLSCAPDLASVDVGEYLQSLVTSLLGTYGTRRGLVDVDVSVAGFCIGIDVAIPLGLILNELVSNALKHAFPEGRGRIEVHFDRRADGALELVVADDGIGLPAGLDVSTAPSLGLQLVSTLAEQIGATLQIDGEVGTRFTVAFEWPRASV